MELPGRKEKISVASENFKRVNINYSYVIKHKKLNYSEKIEFSYQSEI